MNVRKLALDAVMQIIEQNSYSNIVVNEYLNKFELTESDRSLFTNIVYGTVQNLITIQYYLQPYIDGKKLKKQIKYLLYISIYQLVYLDQKEYAVVNEAVSIAQSKDRFLGSFVNGVLRNFLRNPLRELPEDKIDYLSVKYSHPVELIKIFLKDYSFEETEKILIENSIVKNDAIRVNTLKGTKEDVIKYFEENNIPYSVNYDTNNGIIIYESIIKTDLFKKGKITVQDISSQMVSEVLNPKENSYVLDCCSAPGGKSAHLSSIMNNTGKIFACDIYEHKIKLMNKNFKRLGVENVKAQLVDARKIKDYVRKEAFDYILADVPCSGLGVISHKVDLKYKVDINNINDIIVLQKEILNSTKSLLKKGGYYVYSTCTINKDENERQIAMFLEENSDFEKVYERQILPFENHSDGFYICKLKKKDN